jgi:hypothetical protein
MFSRFFTRQQPSKHAHKFEKSKGMPISCEKLSKGRLSGCPKGLGDRTF